MDKRGLCRRAVSVLLSVWVSVTFVYSVEMNKRIFEIFLLSDSHTILVFPCQTLWQYSDGDSRTGAKIAIFDQYLALASTTAGPSRIVAYGP